MLKFKIHIAAQSSGFSWCHHDLVKEILLCDGERVPVRMAWREMRCIIRAIFYVFSEPPKSISRWQCSGGFYWIDRRLRGALCTVALFVMQEERRAALRSLLKGNYPYGMDGHHAFALVSIYLGRGKVVVGQSRVAARRLCYVGAKQTESSNSSSPQKNNHFSPFYTVKPRKLATHCR